MAIEFECNKCGAEHSLPDGRAGLMTVCDCGAELRVPERADTPEHGQDMETIDDATEVAPAVGAQEWQRHGPPVGSVAATPNVDIPRIEVKRTNPVWRYRITALAILCAVAIVVYAGHYLRGQGSGIMGPPTASAKLQLAMDARSLGGIRACLTAESSVLAESVMGLSPQATDAIADARTVKTDTDGDLAVVSALALVETAAPADESGDSATRARSVPVAFGLRHVDGKWLVDMRVTAAYGLDPVVRAVRDGESASVPEMNDLARQVMRALEDAGPP